MWVRDWSSWDIDECKQEMPDYYYCINDQERDRRRLSAFTLPEFKLPNDPTCRNDRWDGYCGEFTTEEIYDDWEILYSQYANIYYENEKAIDASNGVISKTIPIYDFLDKTIFENINEFWADPLGYAQSYKNGQLTINPYMIGASN